MISPEMQANIAKVYNAEAEGCSDPEAQKRLQKQHACMQFTAEVDAQRAQWIPVRLDREDGFDKLEASDAEALLRSKITMHTPPSAENVQKAFTALKAKVEKSGTFVPVSNLVSKFGFDDNEAAAALLLLGFEARHNNNGNFQFKAKIISSG